MSKRYILGIDIGGTHLRLAIVDNNYNLYNEFITNISDFRGTDIKKYLATVIKKYLDKIDYRISAIGIGVPGIVYGDNIISCPNITELENLNLKKFIEDQFGVPVIIEKDVNLIMLAEQKALKIKATNVIGFFIGTGFGCSVIIDGRLYKGARGFACEIGHIPLRGKNDICNCGSKGCLELYAAGKALEKIAAQKNIPINDFFVDLKDSEEVDEFIDNMAIGIATAVNLFDPQLIIIDGGVIRMKGFPLDYLKGLIRKRLRSDIIVEDLKIIDSSIGKFGGCLGAGIYLFEYAKDKL